MSNAAFPGDSDDDEEGTRRDSRPIDKDVDLTPIPNPPTLRRRNHEAPPPLPTGSRATTSEVVPYRPSQRPRMALLVIVDDGQDDGEIVRLRADKYVLGRADGDILIPHDPLISSRHAEVYRHVDSKGKTSWYIRDLNSTNGSYVRIVTASVEQSQQLLIGGRYYRFEDPTQAAEQSDASPETRRALGGKTGGVLPNLIELTEKGDGRRYQIGQAECWIGRDAGKCGVVIADDPMVSPLHVRLYRDPSGRWMMDDAKSRNGTWFRIRKVRFKRTSQFMLGEQRFVLRFLS